MGTTSGLIPAQHQADAYLAQANPVQNTWYTLLDTTTNVVLYSIRVMIATTNENLECRVTLDGNTLTGTIIPATAGTIYYFRPSGITAQLYDLNIAVYSTAVYEALEGRSAKVEIRKTTANGNGTLTGRVIYGRWP